MTLATTMGLSMANGDRRLTGRTVIIKLLNILRKKVDNGFRREAKRKRKDGGISDMDVPNILVYSSPLLRHCGLHCLDRKDVIYERTKPGVLEVSED